MTNSNGLSRGDWFRWTVATGFAALVGFSTITAFFWTMVYPRASGHELEARQDRSVKRFERHEDKVEDRLIAIEQKLDHLRDLWMRRNPQK